MARAMDVTLLEELKLPANVRMVLTPSAAVFSIKQLIQLANQIVEASPTPIMAAVDTHKYFQLTIQVMEQTK